MIQFVLENDRLKAMRLNFDRPAAPVLAVDLNRRGPDDVAGVIGDALAAFPQKRLAAPLDKKWIQQDHAAMEASRFVDARSVHGDYPPGFSHLRGRQAYAARIVIHRFHEIIDKCLEALGAGFNQVSAGF